MEIGQRRVGAAHTAADTAASSSAAIGGHLAYHQSAGASHSATAARTLSNDWIDLGPIADLPDGKPVLRVNEDGDRPAALCVVRRGQKAHVLVNEGRLQARVPERHLD